VSDEKYLTNCHVPLVVVETTIVIPANRGPKYTRGGRLNGAKEQNLAEKSNGVFENGQAIAALVLLAGPAGVMRRVDVPLGMWHQTKDAAGVVAQTGDVALGAIGVVGVRKEVGWTCGPTG
jgi:hypothetical protein